MAPPLARVQSTLLLAGQARSPDSHKFSPIDWIYRSTAHCIHPFVHGTFTNFFTINPFTWLSLLLVHKHTHLVLFPTAISWQETLLFVFPYRSGSSRSRLCMINRQRLDQNQVNFRFSVEELVNLATLNSGGCRKPPPRSQNFSPFENPRYIQPGNRSLVHRSSHPD